MRRSVELGLMLVVLVIAGCGGDDQASTSPSPEAKAYAAKLNAAQAKVLAGVTNEVNGIAPSTRAAAARQAGTISAAFEDFSDRVRAITPPPEVADLHVRLIATLDRITRKLKASAASLQAGTGEAAATSAPVEGIALGNLAPLLVRINEALGLKPIQAPTTIPTAPTSGDPGGAALP